MIIGLTGSFAAGKGAIVDHLVHRHNFKHFSARALIVRELEKRGESINRDTMIRVANELRHTHGPTYIIETLFNEAKAAGGAAVIESIRELAGVRFIKNAGGVVIGVDADPALRYERAVGRGSATDHVSFIEWLAQEHKESNPTNPTKQDIFGALRESDFIIQNNGSLAELQQEIDRILILLDKKQ